MKSQHFVVSRERYLKSVEYLFWIGVEDQISTLVYLDFVAVEKRTTEIVALIVELAFFFYVIELLTIRCPPFVNFFIATHDALERSRYE